MRIAIIIPVHNEGEKVGCILEGIREKKIDVIVIDDGSSDGSGELAKENGAIVLRNEQKQGKGASLRRGFQRALDMRVDGVITMDGDGQHAVGDIDLFLTKIKSDPICVVTGNRMHNSKGMPLLRYTTNRLMSWFISSLCGQSMPDTQCGYRFVHSDILRQLKLTSNEFEIETEVLMQASRLGFKIFSVPIKTIYRNEKSKINPLRDTIRFFAYIFKEVRASRKK